MDRVPISFEHKGKQYKGFFDHVMGAASTRTWHLSVDKYHLGQLLLTERGWAFYSNSTPELHELSEFFGEYMTLWYE